MMLGYLVVAAAAMSWGTWPLFLHDASMPGSLQAAVFVTVATMLSLPVMLRDRIRTPATRGQWFAMGWLGISDALNVVLFFSAYHYTTVAVAVLTHYLAPVLVALAAPLLLGERVRLRSMVAVVVSFVGLVFLLRPWGEELSRADFVGAALGAGSAVFYASNVVVNKRLAGAFSAGELMFFHGLVALPLMWALVPSGAYAAVSQPSLSMVICGAIGPGFLGGIAFVWGLRRIAASHASVLTLLEPFVAVVIAAISWGQRLAMVQLMGGVLILTGAALVVLAPKRPYTQAPANRVG